jgi:hypothetical protein
MADATPLRPALRERLAHLEKLNSFLREMTDPQARQLFGSKAKISIRDGCLCFYKDDSLPA